MKWPDGAHFLFSVKITLAIYTLFPQKTHFKGDNMSFTQGEEARK